MLELPQTALGPGPLQDAARLKPRPEAGDGLQEAVSSAPGCDSTVSAKSDDLTLRMN